MQNTNIQLSIAETVKVRGLYTATICDPRKASAQYRRLCEWLAENPLEKLKTFEERIRHADEYGALMYQYEKRAQVAEMQYSNLVPTVGRSVLAQRLSGVTTYSGTVNYAALGDDTTAPNAGDTVLGNETYRQTISSATYVNNIAYLSVFIIAGTATGTHNEAGLFIDGTGSADTGQIYSHVSLSPAVTKGALNSLTLDITLTLA